jgi:membrane-associated phospholipid phosphatase
MVWELGLVLTGRAYVDHPAAATCDQPRSGYYSAAMPQLPMLRRGTPGSRLGVRLLFAGIAVALVAIPFTLTWVLVVSEEEWLERIDARTATSLTSYVVERPFLTDLLEFLAEATSPWILRCIAVLVAIWLWIAKSRRLAVWLLVTMAIGGLLGLVLKLIVERARPVIEEPIAVAEGFSFPSGHALNSVLFWAAMLVLAYTFLTRPWRILTWLVAIVFVLVTGFDRIALGVHYLSDVVAGWTVGLATVAATVAAFDAWRRAERAPEPHLLEPPDEEPGSAHPVRDILEGKQP